jgi:hypothetical protein
MRKIKKGPSSVFFLNHRKKSPGKPPHIIATPPEKTMVQKVEELMPVLIKFLPELRNIIRQPIEASVDSDGTIIGKMYDFIKTYDNAIQLNGWTGIPTSGDRDQDVLLLSEKENNSSRIEKKPKEVVDELERMPLPWTTKEQDLDKQIAIFKDKTLLTNQRYVAAQLEGIIKRLENRKKYHEYAAFFEEFPNTSDDKIDSLLKKYKLCLNESTLFIPTFPEEAVKIMKQYVIITEKLTGEKPVFYVIAEETDFRDKVKKNDPILLAQSPFGFYWQILGAWDKEMLLLGEL